MEIRYILIYLTFWLSITKKNFHWYQKNTIHALLLYTTGQLRTLISCLLVVCSRLDIQNIYILCVLVFIYLVFNFVDMYTYLLSVLSLIFNSVIFSIWHCGAVRPRLQGERRRAGHPDPSRPGESVWVDRRGNCDLILLIIWPYFGGMINTFTYYW